MFRMAENLFEMHRITTMYPIPLLTKNRRCYKRKKHGGQPRLAETIESLLVKTISAMTNWRVPLDSLDIHLLVKTYLDKCGVTDTRFKDNLPGIDWVRSFMDRHQLTKRIADNVKSSCDQGHH